MNNLQLAPQHIISEDEAKNLLENYLSQFKKSIYDGWAAWETLGDKAPELRVPLSKQCRARFIYDHIVQSARAHFADFPNVKITEKAGLLTLRIDREEGTVIMRFKKLDGKMRARNYPTPQQLAFSLQLELPGWPIASRLNAGYQLNPVETDIKDVLITCPMGNEVKWFFSIKDAEEVGGSAIAPLPVVPSSTPEIPPAALVKAKEVKEAKNERNG